MKQITIKSVLMRLVAVVLLTFGTASVSAQYYMNVFQKDGGQIHLYIPDIDSINFASPFVDPGFTTAFNYEKSGQNSIRNTSLEMKTSTASSSQYLQWNFFDASDCSGSEITNNDYGNGALLLFYNNKGTNSKHVDDVFKIKINELLDSADAKSLRKSIAKAESQKGVYDDNVRDAILEFIVSKQNKDDKFYHVQIRDAYYGVANFIQNGPERDGWFLGIPDLKVFPINTTSLSNYYTIDDSNSNLLGHNTNVRLYYDYSKTFYNKPNTPIYVISWYSIAILLYNEYYIKAPIANDHLSDDDVDTDPSYEYVDLGLSVKWATCNVGATKPEEYGDYFAWGETEPYYEDGYAQEDPQSHWKEGKSAGYDWSTYTWCNGLGTTLTKYNTSSSYGTVDNKTTLDPEDDVAHVKWGGSWRMPTHEEQDELRNNCTWTWYSSGNSEFGGVAGYKVTSNKEGYTDRFIFLPAAGYRSSTGLYNVGSYGNYWSGSLNTGYPGGAWNISFYSSYVGTTYSGRGSGFSVRPVCPSETWWDNISVTIGQETATIHVGGTVSLTALVRKENDVISYPVNWTSDNPAIASVSADGVVTAKAVGQAKITATVQSKSATCIIEVTAASSGNYEYVDLGLSVKWATCNVGATKPEEYGDYYAWGETEPYYEDGYAQEDPQSHWKEGKSAGYAWSTYKWCNGSDNTMTKYCNMSVYGNNGFTDTKTTLDPEDDVAHVKWGGSWRMPTHEEQDELRNNCTWTWYSSGNSEFGGVAGYKVTSNKEGYTDRFIFLPAAGYRYDTYLYNVGISGDYWSSSLNTDYPYGVWGLYFSSSGVDAIISYRYYGFSVRPVCQ